MAIPSLAWEVEALDKVIPFCPYTYCVNPEQSNPEGEAPPAT